jgi:peptidoglycan/xylan/chitin deacetylase (PgdA/CDA1 family)
MLRPRLTRYRLILAATLLAAIAIYFLCDGSVRWILWTILFTGAGLAVGLGVSFPHWQLFGPTLCRFNTDRKAVALTFDDGPDPATTPALLELLARRGVRATFFCVGRRVREHPELAARIAAEGHLVENHTFEHHLATNLFGHARLRADLGQAQAAIREITGRAPAYFRPPMCLTNERVLRVTRELGLTITGYTARALDRRDEPPQKIVARLLRRLEPGAILLLHDADVPAARMLAVVSGVLDALTARGYSCLRFDEFSPDSIKSAGEVRLSAAVATRDVGAPG